MSKLLICRRCKDLFLPNEEELTIGLVVEERGSVTAPYPSCEFPHGDRVPHRVDKAYVYVRGSAIAERLAVGALGVEIARLVVQYRERFPKLTYVGVLKVLHDQAAWILGQMLG